MTGLLLFLAPALLLGLAALLAAAGDRGWARRAAGAGALGAGLLAAFGAEGPFEVPGVLLGAWVGLDAEGRVALAVALLLGFLAVARPAGPADRARAGRERGAVEMLLAAGLAASAVAFDVATLSIGFTAVVLGGAASLLGAEGGRARAAAFMALAVPGEVLLVDALSELGHAAESTRLDAIAAAARADLGWGAVALLAGAYGLPLAAVGLRAPAPLLAALAGQAVAGLARLLPGQIGFATFAGTLALAGCIGLAAAPLARALATRLERRARLEPARPHDHPGGPAPPSAPPVPSAWTGPLDRAESALLGATAAGATLAALAAALLIAALAGLIHRS